MLVPAKPGKNVTGKTPIQCSGVSKRGALSLLILVYEISPQVLKKL